MSSYTFSSHISTQLERSCPESDSIPFFQFHHLARQTCLEHAVFTRVGGVSRHPYDTLNVSSGVSDLPASVRANLELIRRSVGADRLVTLDQTHSGDVIAVRQEDLDRIRAPLKGDGLVTDVPGLGLLVKQADCQAVILYDPLRRVAANVHCGWRGNVSNILGNAVRCMETDFGCMPSHLLVGIGPSLGPCCAEFKGHEEIFPDSFRSFMVGADHFDLWALSIHQMTEAGVLPSNVALSGLCTCCRTDLFFSYRGEGETGRFATVVMITE